jgi:flagellar biosynthesis/type III secretory pathway M-ring protein FliF/YscJ
VDTAKAFPAKAIDWIGKNKVPAALIGAGVAVASIVAGWAIFRAIKARRAKKDGNNRRHPRSFDEIDEVLPEAKADYDYRIAQQDPLDGIDFNDAEFLEFLERFERGDYNLD